MEPYGFLGAWLRLERAREHLAEVRVDADAFFAEERDIGDRVDTLEEGALTIDLREVDVPERLSIVAGEVIANLRSSLDYLIFALAWHDTGHRPSGNWMQKLQFPTSARRRSFRRSAPKQLKGLDSGHVDMVASYLAFSGCFWVRELAELSNEDKHRHLFWLVGRVSLDRPWQRRWRTAEGAIVLDTDLESFEPDELFYEDVTHVEVALEDGRPIVATLERLTNDVEALLRHFAAQFEFAPLRDESGRWR
jgi:hypothetical protein